MTTENVDRLSSVEQKQGRRCYYGFSVFNGLAIICLAQNVLILYALKLGASDSLSVIIASFLYSCVFFMLIGKVVIKRLGSTKTVAYSWIFRHLAALLMAAAPFVSLHVSQSAGLVCLTVCAFFIFVFRAIGVVGIHPLIGEITDDNNRGRFMSHSCFNFSIANILMMGFIVTIFQFSKSISMFQIIIIIGSACGLISAILIFRIKESAIPKLSAAEPILESAIKITRDPKLKKLLLASSFAQSGFILVVPFSMVALKKGYNLPDDQALMFAFVQIIGSILVSYINGIIVEETGPRPLLIIYFIGAILISLFWIFAPVSFSMLFCFIIFFIAGVGSMGVMMGIGQYFQSSVSNYDKVGIGFWLTIIPGLCTGFFGSVVGSGLLKLLHFTEMTELNIFKAYFLIILFMLLVCLLIVIRLERLKDWSVKQVLALPFALRDLRTLYFLYRSENVSDPNKEPEIIDKLDGLGSDLSEKKLLSYLNSPKLGIRARAIMALGHIEFGEETKKTLINELANGEYSTGFYAATILGEHNVKEALPLFKKFLDSKDIYLRGKCMIALALMKESSCYPRIKEIFSIAKSPRTVINGAFALTEINDSDSLPLLLNKALEKDLLFEVRYEILYCISDLFNKGEEFYNFIKEYQLEPEQGMRKLTEIFEESENEAKDIFIEKINHFYEEKISKVEVFNFIKEKLKNSLNDSSNKILFEFLEKSSPDQIPHEMIFCLVLLIWDREQMF